MSPQNLLFGYSHSPVGKNPVQSQQNTVRAIKRYFSDFEQVFASWEWVKICSKSEKQR